MTLQLKKLQPFAQGGNRLCFIHPENPQRCVKVRRPDFTLKDCRRKKGFPKNLRPLSSFDDNREEHRVLIELGQRFGEGVFQHIYRCFGFVDTDLGPGLETELICDYDDRISVSLKQFIWEHGYSAECQKNIQLLKDFWSAMRIPSRELLTHNLVVQLISEKTIARLVVVDGLGDPTLLPFSWLPQRLQSRRVSKRLARLDDRIEEFVQNCRAGKQVSNVGMLLHRNAASSEVNGKAL